LVEAAVIVAPEPVKLSDRVLQLATEIAALEDGGATAERVEALEAELAEKNEALTRQRESLRRQDEVIAAQRERIKAMEEAQTENARLMARLSELTMQNQNLWKKVNGE
jgi:septal ring factor EnvC (AmiA/AmiB activator)